MKGEKPYIVWNAKLDTLPPTSAVELVRRDEELLWAAVIPSRVTLRAGWTAGLLVALISFGYFLMTPWGQSFNEYCAANSTRSCGRHYYWWYFGSIFFIAVYAFALMQWLRGKFRSFLTTYAITDKTAYSVMSIAPKRISSVDLKAFEAFRSASGLVSIGRGQTGIALLGLDDDDSAEALYWANRSRFTSSIETKTRDTTYPELWS
jgi:hypothetical protein